MFRISAKAATAVDTMIFVFITISFDWKTHAICRSGLYRLVGASGPTVRAKRALFFHLATARAGAIGRDSALRLQDASTPVLGGRFDDPSLVNRLTSSISKSQVTPPFVRVN
jgi:hypothetical protein